MHWPVLVIWFGACGAYVGLVFDNALLGFALGLTFGFVTVFGVLIVQAMNALSAIRKEARDRHDDA